MHESPCTLRLNEPKYTCESRLALALAREEVARSVARGARLARLLAAHPVEALGARAVALGTRVALLADAAA